MTEQEYDTVRVARIGRPHGIRGEVTVEVFTDTPAVRFASGNKLIVQRPGQAVSNDSLTLEAWRMNKKIHLLKFVEITDRDTAESYRNVQLFASVKETDEEAWYANDLIGFSVHVGARKTPSIGEVADLITGDAQDLLVVRLADSREVLLPFVEEIVPEMDEGRELIIITPPPGLLELNQD